MRALSKGKASQFFKKQQKKQDLQEIVNQIEAKSIANQVGIAQEQISQFKWFFDQIAKFKLPDNYKKVLNEKKNQIFYIQKSSNESTLIHPLINLIKSFFYESYRSNKSTFTFQKKKQKLLPYVEQKMMKNTMSLNSKRREVQKLNLQKDQNGNNVLSKMARLKPDMKNLISARNYMLKMLVEKVYTSKQLWGKGKRAKTFASIINQKHKGVDEQQIQEKQPFQDLQTYQRIFTEAAKFYEQQYGDLRKIPESILKSQDYMNSTPQKVLKNMFVLNISKNQIQYYWFARLMDCFKIPHNWSRQRNTSFETYVYDPLKLTFQIHPSYIFIIMQMNQFKSYFNDLSNQQQSLFYKDRQMTFFDFFQRQYTVDIYGLALKEQLKSSFNLSQTARQKYNNSHNQNDWMIVEAINNSQIKKQQYPLIGKFCEFWRSRNFEDEQWIPSVSPFGQVTWSSTVNYSAIKYCPYKEKLAKIIQTEGLKLESLKSNYFKKQIREYINLLSNEIEVQINSQASVLLLQVAEEREMFLKHYVSQLNEETQEAYAINEFDLNEYFNLIFTCPFALDDGVQQMEFVFNKTQSEQSQIANEEQQNQIPLWIIKSRARKFSFRIKNGLQVNHDFDSLKQQVNNYAIQITKKEESHKLEEVQQQLRNIKNSFDMNTFLQFITDVDARQERKRKRNQMMNQSPQQNNDDDFFGSEEENVNIEELQQQSSQSSQEVSEEQNIIQITKQNMPLQSSSQSSQQQILKQQTLKDESFHQIDQRQQYSFLIDDQIFQTSPQMDKMTPQIVDNLLKSKIKNQIKKYKYSSKNMKNALKQRFRMDTQFKTQEQIQNLKKNMLITNFKYKNIPYKNNGLIRFNEVINTIAFQKVDSKQSKRGQHKQKTQQDEIVDRIDSFPFFQSFMEDYEADSVIQQINSLPKKQIKLPSEPSQDLNPENQVDQIQSQQQIILQPIKRTKPDILLDPRLRHINSVDAQSQLNMFRITFFKKGPVKQASPSKLKLTRSKSIPNNLNQLYKKEKIQNQKTPLKKLQLKNNPAINPFETIKKLTKSKLLDQTNQSTVFPASSNYNRVCLGHTATNFLVSQPLKRKSELLVVEARKNLLHKGRGLATYVSKKY